MATQNLYDVQSPEHFQQLLSADLNRVSVLNFWAPFADPCKQMNEIFKELAGKYPAALFLQIQAEDQADITDSFEIEAVPTFLLLRGHTLLKRISGADAPTLTQSVQKHATSPAYSPLSKTDQQPAKATDSSAPAQPEETQEQLEERCKKLMNQSKVVLFMKGDPQTPRCGFSRKIVALLQEQNVQFTTFDILTDEAVRQGM
ncbi:monothiol glutaredoxin-5 [Coprinopsis cinerea AmutBmut pab1-1]|nr:monothiol glutaredoxin-5 [Coprinopsis cinerea AmutBmut pab1-1]